nr:MAG TPA: hypothetical protein [Bacteriophage sp.]
MPKEKESARRPLRAHGHWWKGRDGGKLSA